MKSFTLERSAVSEELSQVLTEWQDKSGLGIPSLKPRVILFTKKMSHRADRVDQETAGVSTLELGLAEAVSYESTPLQATLGRFALMGGQSTPNPRCFGFRVLRERRKKRDALDLLLDERRKLAGIFGIKLNEHENSHTDIYATVLFTRHVDPSKKKKGVDVWNKEYANRRFEVVIGGLKLKPGE